MLSPPLNAYNKKKHLTLRVSGRAMHWLMHEKLARAAPVHVFVRPGFKERGAITRKFLSALLQSEVLPIQKAFPALALA
jgi:hypothetical protein